MQLLGHKDIRMTLRYVQVLQQDLEREFHLARQKAAPTHRLPTLPIPSHTPTADLAGIHQALAATRHLLEMYRRSFPDEKSAANSNASIGASSRAPVNWITSLKLKNEETLAGQLTLFVRRPHHRVRRGCRRSSTVLLGKLRVVAQFERLHAMRFQLVRPPDPAYRGGTHSHHLSQAPRAPMGGVERSFLGGLVDDLLDLFGRNERWKTPS
jgi:hypothetical protein